MTPDTMLGAFFTEMWAVVRSETFWLAVAALGGIGVLLATRAELRDGRSVNAYRLMREEDARFDSEKVRKYRADLAKALLSGAPFDELNRLDCADGVLDPLEDWGTLSRFGLVPDYVMWTTSAWYILRYWLVTRPYIEWVRRDQKDSTYFQEFERLYKRMLNLEERGKRVLRLWNERVPFAPTQRELNRFLIEELDVEPFSLRKCEVSDLPRVSEIEVAVFDEIFRYPNTKFEDLYREHPDGFTVAELLDKTVVGYVIAYPTGADVGDIDSLAVDPAFQRVGVGLRLARHALDQLRSQGIRHVSLEVHTGNLDSLRLFNKLGFNKAGKIDDYYAPGADAYQMSLDMSAVRTGGSPPRPASRDSKLDG